MSRLAPYGPVLAAMLPALAIAAASPQDIDGVWKTEPRDNGAYITVRIGPCSRGADTRCGVVDGAHAGARPDIIGDRILRGLKPGEDGWTDGEIIRPGKGTVYRSSVRRTGEATIEVTGCGLAGLVCRSQTWTKVR